MPHDALYVLIGVVLGVAAAIPTSLLIAASARESRRIPVPPKATGVIDVESSETREAQDVLFVYFAADDFVTTKEPRVIGGWHD